MRRVIVSVASIAALGGLSAVAEGKKGYSRGCGSRDCQERVCVSRACQGRVQARKARAREASAGRAVTASWYGPGLYGNSTACGQTLTPGLAGVAHKSLACGTRLRLCAARCTTTRVIDRGPYVAGRELDLTAPVRDAVGLSGVGTVRMQILG